MHVTVAICTWNRAPLLRQALGSLTGLVIPAGLTWTVLVVNNNSTDSTNEVAEEFRGRLPLEVVLEREPGLPHARNRALAEAKGEYVAYIDDDVLVDPLWLQCLAGAVERHPDAVAFGGPIEPWFPVPPDPVLAEAFPNLKIGFCGLNHGPEEIALDVKQEIFGANMVFSKSRLGGLAFDPRIGHAHGSMMLGDETILLIRLHQRGERVIWVPGMRLKHYVDPSRMTLPYLLRYYEGVGRGQARVYGEAEPSFWRGVPRWLVRKQIESRLRYWLARFSRGRLEALTALREHVVYSGMAREYRARHSETSGTRQSRRAAV
jgi:glycosyltransferase involved in cell wall biosynthesis